MKPSKLKRGKRRVSKPEDRERWWSTWTGICASCGGSARDRHHVIYRQHVRDLGGDEWEPANAMDLCRDCHDTHHAGIYLSVRLWSEDNWQFARDLKGEAAEDYARRYYAPFADEVGSRISDPSRREAA